MQACILGASSARPMKKWSNCASILHCWHVQQRHGNNAHVLWLFAGIQWPSGLDTHECCSYEQVHLTSRQGRASMLVFLTGSD